MKPAAVIDTNVVVAGLLSSTSDAPTVRILDAMVAGRILFLLSVELVDEYRRVLLREAIRARHGLSEADVDWILTELLRNAAVREPIASSPRAPDGGDRHLRSLLHLWDLLAAQLRAVLVTGDRRLLERPRLEARVMSPDAFAGRHLRPARRTGG